MFFIVFMSLWFPPLQIEPATAQISDIEALEVAEMFDEKFVEFSADQSDDETDLKILAQRFLSAKQLTYGGPLRDRRQARRERKNRTPEEIGNDSKSWRDQIRDRRKQKRADRRENLKWLFAVILIAIVAVVVFVSQFKKFFGAS